MYRQLFALLAAAALSGAVSAQDAPIPRQSPKPSVPAPKTAPARPSQAGKLAKKKPVSGGVLPKGWDGALRWRSIGPANMGGRITAIAVHPTDSSTWWAGTAAGGLLKTVNDGASFVHQFEREASGSIGDIAVAPSNPDIVWVGTGEANPRNSVSWGRGVYRSDDGGKTFVSMGLKGSFQIGAVAIHQNNPEVVFVGALGRLWGPSDERGLFKTDNGGKTWNKILFVDAKTGVIDVQFHPSDPDTLLVATWERERDGFDTNDPAKRHGPGSGLWKSIDGGETFVRITEGLPPGPLGRMGLAWSRSNPDIVYAVVDTKTIGTEPPNAPYMGITGANADAGARLTSVAKGSAAEQAGLKKDDIVLAINDTTVHSYNDLVRLARGYEAGGTATFEVSRARRSVKVELTFGKRPKPRAVPGRRTRSYFGGMLGGQRANLQDQQGKKGAEFGGIYKSDDAGETWTRVNSLNPRPMYFSEIRVDPNDKNRVFVLGIRAWRSDDGGKTFTSNLTGRGVHVDHHALWIDPNDSRHMILGNDGGIYTTRDDGSVWEHLNQVAIGQFYHVAVGPRRNYRVYGGLQDNGSWGGPSRVAHGQGPTNADWFRIGGGDGFVCRVDADDPDQIYFESQNGGLGRRHLESGERAFVRPRPPRGQQYRFNWNTPFVLSHHNARIYYVAGNRVFRSLDRGSGVRTISPGITTTKRGSATALAESPLDPNVLYVGTDDGALWMTRDGGHNWHDLFNAPPAADPAAKKNTRGRAGGRAARMRERLKRMDTNGDGALQADEVPERMRGFFARLDTDKNGVVEAKEIEAMAPAAGNAENKARATTPQGLPLAKLVAERRYVSSIEPSRKAAGRVYVVLDGHRSNDDRPQILVSEDFGRTWRSLAGALPARAGTTRVLREDRVRPELLYLGTEFGAYVSLDRGAIWSPLGDLPTVPVHEFAQHKSTGDIVAATHGRSLWVLNVTALRQVTAEAVRADVHLFEPETAVMWRSEPSRGAARGFSGSNPPYGTTLVYAFKKEVAAPKLRIETLDGKLLREQDLNGKPGVHVVQWNLRRDQTRPGRFRRFGPRVRPGTYRVVLVAGEKTKTATLRVEIDPDHRDPAWIAFEEAEEAHAAQQENEEGEEFDDGDYDH